ncbi:hypothetical protein ASE11_00300 [Hydrogenophaga sp. Root209]|uniref:DUF1275 family protein n=1 Tax=unclassified Hydrogenophaga TaxID=2610897 RepID=UPI0006FCA643|nr:DUF1275 family protein [Hydrogenophaga sp. Root209]KRC11965.1 hypothetical protein ASE11_00300 [Hydrogenophaga sp. Root209]
MIRSLTHKVRTRCANRQWGGMPAFVAGAASAGGFLAIQRYTTHMTGIVTDLGIELGRLLYRNRTHAGNLVHFVEADRDKLGIHASILGLFFAGGLAGALAFKQVGFVATVPLALVLSAVAAPLWQDLGDWLRRQESART